MNLDQKTEQIDNLLSEGFYLYGQGQINIALEYFFQALKIIRRVAGILSTESDLPKEATYLLATREATALNNVGSVYQDQGKLAEALEQYQKALVINSAIAPKSRETATYSNNVGRIYHTQGKLPEALEQFEQALKIESATAPNSAQTAIYFNNIGLVYQDQGKLAEALEQYQKALVINSAVAPKSRETATYFNNIGFVYQAQGKITEALERFEKALKIDFAIAPNSAQTAMYFNNIGSVYRSQGKLTKAMGRFEKALAIFQAIETESPQVAYVLSNIGSIYQEQRKLTEALEQHQKALAIDLAVAPESTETARDFNNIGGVYQAQGKLAEALGQFEQALKIESAITPESTGVATYLINIGLVYQAQGKHTEALERFEKAVDIIESLRMPAGDILGRQGWFADNLTAYHYIIYFCVTRDQPGDIERAFGITEKIHARSLLDRMQEKTVRATTNEQEDLLKEERDTVNKLLSVEEWLRQNRHTVPAQDGQKQEQEYTRLKAVLRNLEERIRREIPGYALLKQVTPLGTTGVRRKVLDPNTLLLSFCFTGKAVVGWAMRYAGFVGSGSQMFMLGEPDTVNKVAKIMVAEFNLPPRIHSLMSQAEKETDEKEKSRIEAEIDALHNELADAQEDQEQASEMLTELWEQVDTKLKAGVTRLIIVPDGELNALPFELIVTNPETGETLGDKYAITYAPSATALHNLRELWDKQPAPPADSPHGFWGFAAPDFDSDSPPGASRAGFAPLTFARAEMEAIAALFPGSLPLYGKDVTKSRVDAAVTRATVVHAATHGVFNNTDPLGSGLVLAGGDVWEARDFLGRREPMMLELLVASACDTGRGEARPGEGLVGFSTALMAVGVKCAVVSLWPVNDNATKQFMIAFYEDYRIHRSPSKALRAGRRRLTDKENGYGNIYGEPRHWAAFVAFGLPEADAPPL